MSMSKGKHMGIPLELVTRIQDWANVALVFSLVIGVVSTALVVWSGGLKEEYLNRELAQSKERTAQLELARVQLEAKIAPRRLSQEQQNDLAKALASLPKMRGTLIPSPSTPESEMFARALASPLISSGWDINILPGTPTATLLFPTGVVVGHIATAPVPKSVEVLVSFLNEAGIPATAIPSIAVGAPNLVKITVSSKH